MAPSLGPCRQPSITDLDPHFEKLLPGFEESHVGGHENIFAVHGKCVDKILSSDALPAGLSLAQCEKQVGKLLHIRGELVEAIELSQVDAEVASNVEEFFRRQFDEPVTAASVSEKGH